MYRKHRNNNKNIQKCVLIIINWTSKICQYISITPLHYISYISYTVIYSLFLYYRSISHVRNPSYNSEYSQEIEPSHDPMKYSYEIFIWMTIYIKTILRKKCYFQNHIYCDIIWNHIMDIGWLNLMHLLWSNANYLNTKNWY